MAERGRLPRGVVVLDPALRRRSARLDRFDLCPPPGGRLFVDAGLIRSIAPLALNPPVWDVLVDERGNPHDPDAPSAVRERLLSADWSEAEIARAERLLALRQEAGLIRDSGPRPPDLPPAAGRPRRLLVDQAQDDPALTALPHAADAVARLAAALSQDRDACAPILLRPPGGPGVLEARAGLAGLPVLDRTADLGRLLALVDEVWTVSAHLGLDGLLAGLPVTAFGAAWWTAWGLTRPAPGVAPSIRRTLSGVQLFAGLLAQSRFVDPLTGRPCPAELAVERLAVLRAHAVRVAGAWRGVRLPPPKHRLLGRLLSGPFSTYGAAGAARQVAWAAPAGRAPPGAPIPAGAHLAEDGFIRSAGLGVQLIPAASLVLDAQGAHYDPAQESELEALLNRGGFPPAFLERAARLRRLIVSRGASKYNLPRTVAPEPAMRDARRRILIPGQVENDASVLSGGGGWSNARLIEAVRSENPEAYLVYKPHPDVLTKGRPGAVPDDWLTGRVDEVDARSDIVSAIEAADEVHALTSLAGFEALLRGKAVRLHGLPFYGGWGLTRDAKAFPRPRRALGLDELVAGALILYPVYLDPQSGLPCTPEHLVAALSAARDRPARPPTRLQLLTSLIPTGRTLY